MAEQQTLSAVDATWFRIDQNSNTADVVAMMTFDGQLHMGRLRDVVRERFGQFPEFTRRVVDPGGAKMPYWAEVPDFDIDDHIAQARLAHGTREDLETFVDDVLAHRLSRDKPLWQMWVVTNYGRGSALVVKVHHCIGDGFALLGVLLALCDQPPADGAANPEAAQRPSLGGQLFHGVVDAVRHPSHLVEGAKATGRMATALGHLLLMPFDTETSLQAPLYGIRRAAWSRGLALDRFIGVAHESGSTVNDVLLTILSGALRRCLFAAGEEVEDPRIRALIPVNLRPQEDVGKELGNRFGLVFLEMPVGQIHFDARLAHIHASMDELKHSAEPVVAFGLLGALGLVPAVVEHLATDILSRKASVVVANVPGPREHLHLVGERIEHVMFWVPHPARLGLGVSLLSYAGEVRIGVRADQSVMADPHDLVDAFELELEKMETRYAYIS